MSHIRVHGHRGARARRPENTLAAFRYAIGLGVDAVELDVLVTQDDVPVVVHDPFLNREICGGPEVRGGMERAVRSMTLSELREYDCGRKPNPRFPGQQAAPGERIPTLDEVFALGAGNAVWFNVEAKLFPDRPDLAPEPGPFAELILERIEKHLLGSRVIVQSFDARLTRAMGKLAPEIPRSALWETERAWPDVEKDFGITMLSPMYSFVTPGRVAWAHRAGLEVTPWTVNLPEEWAHMAEAGVDAIITDDPASLLEWLADQGLR